MREDGSRILDADKAQECLWKLIRACFESLDSKEILNQVTDQIQWMDATPYAMVHNKEELKALLETNLEGIGKPEKVIFDEDYLLMPICEGCVSAAGTVQVFSRKESNIRTCYQFLCTMVHCPDGTYRASGMHISIEQRPDEIGRVEYLFQGERLKRISNDILNEHIYDPLTGLYSVKAFIQLVSQYLLEEEGNGQYAIVYTDVLNFEKLNNLYGFETGNEIVLELTNVLTMENRHVVYAARGIADHLVIFTRMRSEEELKQTVLRLSNEFSEVVRGRFSDVTLRVIIGVYPIYMNRRELDVSDMIEYANIACKSIAQNNQLGYASYDANMYAQVMQEKKIEQKMQQAYDNDEFKVFLQPKYDLQTERIVGAEALVRWIDYEGMMVYPDEFIPLFEKNGFIELLDFHMLDRVCQFIREELDAGRRCLPISVNQSRYLLNNSTYVTRIAGILEQYRIPPSLIELELTERLFSEHLENMASIMGQLKDKGISWSIDDFGAGYSSLNLLKDLPVDTIKIDKGFLNETYTSEATKIIIRKTVELTRELNKDVICEGVETEEQADYLRQIHCNKAQGYLYAKPMPIEEYRELLLNEIA